MKDTVLTLIVTLKAKRFRQSTSGELVGIHGLLCISIDYLMLPNNIKLDIYA